MRPIYVVYAPIFYMMSIDSDEQVNYRIYKTRAFLFKIPFWYSLLAHILILIRTADIPDALKALYNYFFCWRLKLRCINSSDLCYSWCCQRLCWKNLSKKIRNKSFNMRHKKQTHIQKKWNWKTTIFVQVWYVTVHDDVLNGLEILDK